MRAAILAATLALSAGHAAMSAALAAQPAAEAPEQAVEPAAAPTPDPAPALRATAPPNAAPDRTYDAPGDALLEADLDYLVRQAHSAEASDANPIYPVLRFVDAFEQNNLPAARAALVSAPGGADGGVGDLLEPFLLAAEGQPDRAVERLDAGADNLPAPLPDMARGMVFEAAGRLDEAAAVYADMLGRIDLTPPPQSEPANIEEFQRALGATRITHAVYRAALVQHRLGHADEARRLYAIVTQFAPRSADVERNLARLDRGEAPLEPALDNKRAMGRWLIAMSEFLTQSESLASMLAQSDPSRELPSTTGALFLQLGLTLAPDANDWRLYAVQELVSAGGLDGAQRILDQTPSDSPFAPDAEIARASIALERHDDAAAIAAAERAVAAGGERWSVIASAADIYRQAGRTGEAISAYDRALAMVQAPTDRADILGYRAYAHRFSGDLSAATADVRAAYALDQGVDTRLLYVSILMDDPRAWRDGVQMARTLFAEQPDSVLRLNALGYALIQQPEGLEEGYRLLWRGFNYGQTDYAVVDSLGWAYYLYGQFDEARALIERANQLSDEPNPELLDHLGDVYWRLDRREDARAQWQSALQARPDLLRRRSLEQKVSRGLTSAAPRRRDLPTVSLPEGPAERGDL